MDPAAAVPLQFSIDAAGLVGAVLVGIWWIVRRRYVGATGAMLLGVAQIVFAAQLVTPDGDLWEAWGVVRVLAAAIMLVPSRVDSEEWGILAVGAFGMAGGALWQTIAGQDAVDLAAPARVLLGIGAVGMAVWAWRRSRNTVRLRILASLVLVLGVVILVAGGAVLRVATTDALNAASNNLDRAAAPERDRLLRTAEGLLQRAVTASALVSAAADRSEAIERLRRDVLSDASFLVMVTDDERVVGGEEGEIEQGESETLVSSAAVSAGLEGSAVTASIPIGGAPIVGVAPVYTSADARSADDVVGALVLGRRVELLDGERIGPDVQALRLSRTQDDLGDLRGDRLITASAPVAFDVPPEETIVLAQPAAAVVEGSTSVSRALIAALLAAGLLAIVVALWIGDRLTRPILAAVEGAEVVKAQFLDSLSHELRTPLTPIRGYTELLSRDRARTRRGAYLDEIQGAAQRLDRIVTLLVDVATIQAGRLQISPEPIDVRELLTDVAESWSKVSTEHTLKVRVPKEAPTAMGDPNLVRRVLEELVDNAVKFSPDGGEVELRGRRAGDSVELSVSDEGIGLDPEAASALSSAFVQAEPGHTRRFGGLGLGLTYASGVLAAHDTRLAVTARSKGGARFGFTLPANGMVARMSDRASTS